MFCRRVDIFLKNGLRSSVWIITMIRSFLSSDDSAVGLDVFKTIVGSFKYLTRTIMSSGFWNFLRMYCFRFSPNLSYWSLDYLCSVVVPKPGQNPSLLPWSSWLTMCVMGGWSVRLVRHFLGDRLFWYDLLGHVLVPRFLNFICSSQRHGWLLRHYRPCHCFPRQVRPFLFPE